MFMVYINVDHYDENLLTSQRQFFPLNKKERTYERYLAVLPTIFEICRDAHQRAYLTEIFNTFWNKCLNYLVKCGYEDTGFMTKSGVFYRMSFNVFRKQFQDNPEGLDVMYKWFKACFGIDGNEEYCVIDSTREDNKFYDWLKMRACYEALADKTQSATTSLYSVMTEWSEENKNFIREVIQKHSKKPLSASQIEECNKVLDEIRKKNEKEEIQ